jgi:hypothetical protein
MKFRRVGVTLFRADRRTDEGRTDMTVTELFMFITYNTNCYTKQH